MTPKRVKDAHRKIMLANHPDRGGSPYMASKSVSCLSGLAGSELWLIVCRINEAKDLLEKVVR